MSELKLDAPYFKKNLEIMVRDIERYTPDEMSRALNRLANIAKPALPSDEEITQWVRDRKMLPTLWDINLIKAALNKWGNGCG